MRPNAFTSLNDLLLRWERVLADPRWYFKIDSELAAFCQRLQSEARDTRRICKNRLYEYFEAHLVRGDIALAPSGPEMDAERKPIDTIVIHHTGNPPGMTQERLSAMELVRLYAPYFAKPTEQGDLHLRGRPIGSGHLRNGRQVFWPYHWIVRGNGKAERLLYDSEIGWHAGDWDVNCRSIAIVLDNDYGRSSPSVTELRSIAGVVEQYYRGVALARIFGHREVNSKTTCPSDLFLDTPRQKGWKDELLRLASGQSQRAA